MRHHAPAAGHVAGRAAEVVAALPGLGYTDAWSAEVNGTDAFTPLALAAKWAGELRLGTAIAPVYARGHRDRPGAGDGRRAGGAPPGSRPVTAAPRRRRAPPSAGDVRTSTMGKDPVTDRSEVMKQRDQITMTAQETAAFLAASRKVQLATINPDGTPHLVTMYYVMTDGRISFWTYRSSQKARNLSRDPRVTCLVEDGEQYFDLRGVQLRGVTRLIDDPAQVRAIGRRIVAMFGPDTGSPEGLAAYVEKAARKRVAYIVEPERVASWDHAKLLPDAG